MAIRIPSNTLVPPPAPRTETAEARGCEESLITEIVNRRGVLGDVFDKLSPKLQSLLSSGKVDPFKGPQRALWESELNAALQSSNLQAPKYFQSYEQTKTQLLQMQTDHPGLVSVETLGPSSEKVRGLADRDVMAIHLGNKSVEGKPKIVFLAGVHAREIANPAMMMKWAQSLLEQYGKDPQITALLDTREIEIVPMVNPDGHAMIEKGFQDKNARELNQRKNTDGPGGDGVDINRNFDVAWKDPGGASTDPRAEDYKGPSAASEPETQAIQAFLAREKPQAMVDFHSYSELNLYPYGWTDKPAPDDKNLQAVTEKLTGFNGYTSEKDSEMYITTGSTDDYAYTQLGIPGFTVETGQDFLATDSEFDRIYQENAPALTYLAQAADRLFTEVRAPDAVSATVSGNTLTAQLKDSLKGQKIAGAELFTDPFATPGSGIPLAAADGKFDSANEAVSADLSQLASGARMVYVRARDEQGNWGPAIAQWVKPPAVRSGVSGTS